VRTEGFNFREIEFEFAMRRRPRAIGRSDVRRSADHEVRAPAQSEGKQPGNNRRRRRAALSAPEGEGNRIPDKEEAAAVKRKNASSGRRRAERAGDRLEIGPRER
jgi:hypothetical protein